MLIARCQMLRAAQDRIFLTPYEPACKKKVAVGPTAFLRRSKNLLRMVVWSGGLFSRLDVLLAALASDCRAAFPAASQFRDGFLLRLAADPFAAVG